MKDSERVTASLITTITPVHDRRCDTRECVVVMRRVRTNKLCVLDEQGGRKYSGERVHTVCHGCQDMSVWEESELRGWRVRGQWRLRPGEGALVRACIPAHRAVVRRPAMPHGGHQLPRYAMQPGRGVGKLDVSLTGLGKPQPE